MEYTESTQSAMLGARVPEWVKERIQEESDQQGITLSEFVSQALSQHWQVTEENTELHEQVAFLYDENQKHDKVMAELKVKYELKLQQVQQETKQRLERLIQFVHLGNLLSSKRYQERCLQVFHEPLPK